MPAEAERTLADLPAPLWGPLLRAVRRALDQVDRSELPGALRPFARWKPERLAAERPRRAVAHALASDPRLRESVAELLEHQDALAAAADGADAARLADRYGDDAAAAALVARGRWDALGVLAAAADERLAGGARVGAERASRRRAEAAEAALQRAAQEVEPLREERDAQRRRADAAEERLRRALDDVDRLTTDVGGLREQLRQAREDLSEERRRSTARLSRARRRTEQAEARARVDDARALRVAAELEALSAELRRALAPPEGRGAKAAHAPDAAVVPRAVPPATPGRPCRLPPGLGEDDPEAVRALLQVDRIDVVVDGYNVTKDSRGLPHASLADQRRWLVRLVAGVAARHRLRVTVVFDGDRPRHGLLPIVRGVSVIFTSGEEIADQRIVALVAGAPGDPTLVVSSDREVRVGCAALGANTASSAAFLLAVDA